MTIPQLFLVIVVIIPLALVVLDRLRADVAALLIAIALGAAQYLGLGVLGAAHSPQEAIRAISGFGQPVILTLLSLFIITHALDGSGVTRWIARAVLEIGGRSEQHLIAIFAVTTALLSLVMNNLAAGALMLPGAMEIARRTRTKPSKLLIPVAYGSLLGGTATYFTTANMIVSDLLVTANPPQPPLHILAFTPTGGLIAAAGILFLVIIGWRWLPDREPLPEQMIARMTSRELEDFYHLGERLWEARVLPGSRFANRSLLESEIGSRLGLTVAGVWHGQHAIFAPSPDQVIHPGDILLIVGREEQVKALGEAGCVIGRDNSNGHISEKGVSFIEVMPSPHSRSIGHTLRELEFRARYQLTALALFRGGRSHRTDVGNIPLMLGDSLLMIGPRNALQRLRNNPDFIVLEPNPYDQPLQRASAALAVGVLLISIVAAVLGFPVYLAMLAGAVILLVSGNLEIEEGYRSIEWQAIILIGGMYSVSVAMVNTGLAQWIGKNLLTPFTPLGGIGLAAGAYILTSLLTQVMGGQVTALVTAPITISAAISMGANPQAVAVATAIGCSASFFTPIAHPVNILMIAPGNYHFSDFFHLGWRLTLVCFITLIIGLMLFWEI